jgi:hypothetical protein
MSASNYFSRQNQKGGIRTKNQDGAGQPVASAGNALMTSDRSASPGR